MSVGSAGLDESIEGRLVTMTGTLTAKPKRSSGGDVTIVLERDGAASVKVIADDSSELALASLKVGTTYQVVGVVGQRATHKDALDGYRVCLRDSTDLIATRTGVAPVSRSTAAGSAAPRTGPAGAIKTVAIAQALRLTDRDIAIDAVVTAAATLLDATGRRIVVQDAGGAIELLVPIGVAAPPIGTGIHAEGRVGLAYGAPRFRAALLDLRDGGRVPSPMVLHGQPDVAHEWRLVTLTGRIESVHKLGDRWRAELAVGSQRVVMVGQPGSGIASSALVEGRTATVVGIVRRPFPTATDRRFGITPRFPADVRVAGGTIARQTAGSVAHARPAGGGGPSGAGVATASTGSVDADLIDLAALVGRMVRVGGLVTDLRPDGVMLDDGTTIGRVVVRAAARDLLPLLEPDDAINATGRVEQFEDGPAVVVDDPGGIIQVGDPGAPDPAAGAAPVVVAASSDPASSPITAGLSGESWLGAGAVGFATLSLLSGASLAITFLQRQQARRRLAARIALRLAAFEPPSVAPPSPRSPERESSTIPSA
jgi:hypothetical protein